MPLKSFNTSSLKLSTYSGLILTQPLPSSKKYKPTMFESYQWSITVLINYLIINIAMCFDYYVVSNNVFTPTKGLFNFQGKRFFRKKPSLVPKIPLSFPSPWNACHAGYKSLSRGRHAYLLENIHLLYHIKQILFPGHLSTKMTKFITLFWLVPLISRYCGLTYHFSRLVYKLRKVT